MTLHSSPAISISSLCSQNFQCLSLFLLLSFTLESCQSPIPFTPSVYCFVKVPVTPRSLNSVDIIQCSSHFSLSAILSAVDYCLLLTAFFPWTP